jgi:2-oxoglutarate dehydrogenase E1 component
VKEGVADWAMGEALAIGSLLRDKIHIRFTGEDVERGTMAHRYTQYHACIEVFPKRKTSRGVFFWY